MPNIRFKLARNRDCWHSELWKFNYASKIRFAVTVAVLWVTAQMCQSAVVELSDTEAPVPKLQTTAEQDQLLDAIESLFDRIEVLESKLRATQDDIAMLHGLNAEIEDKLSSDRGVREKEAKELRGNLLSVSNSLFATNSKSISKLDERVQSLRSEGEIRRHVISKRQEGITNEIAELRNEFEFERSNGEVRRQGLAVNQDDISDRISGLRNEFQSERSEGVTRRRDWAMRQNVITNSLAGLNAKLDELESESQAEFGRVQSDIDAEKTQRRVSDSWFAIATLVLLSFIVLVLIRDRKRDRKRVEDLKSQIDGAQFETSEKSLTLLEKLLATQNETDVQDPDHSLVLIICNELNRIENNLLNMDSQVRGHKQLKSCVRRLKEGLHVANYEITELREKPYDEGLLVEADFVLNQNLEPGQRIISRVNRPEVRFRDKIIQNASIRVSVNN